MTRPFFSRERVTDFDNFDRHAADAIALVQQRMSEGVALDFQVPNIPASRHALRS